MRLRFFGCTIAALFAALLLPSCSARIEGRVLEGGKAELSLDISMEKQMSLLIRSFSIGRTPGAPVLDAKALSRSLGAVPGAASASLENKSPTAISGTLSIARIGDFLNAAEKGRPRFITFEESRSGGKSAGRILLSLSRQAGPALLTLISEDVQGYLSALMAPVATGENISKQGYLDLVTSIYGKGVAGEIAAARIKAKVTFPSPIISIRGGTASGKVAEFDVPLLDILVLEASSNYEIRW